MSEQTTPTDASFRAILASIRFDANGLVPAIAQQHDTGEVLMMAWMNARAVQETLATGRVCYYSRSRQALWRKGETSGQSQHLRELRVDCDGDTLLVLVQQDGVACHTGRRSCFYRAAHDGKLVEIAAPLVSPESLYGQRAHSGAAGHFEAGGGGRSEAGNAGHSGAGGGAHPGADGPGHSGAGDSGHREAGDAGPPAAGGVGRSETRAEAGQGDATPGATRDQDHRHG